MQTAIEAYRDGHTTPTAILKVLHAKGHTNISYKDLWSAYKRIQKQAKLPSDEPVAPTPAENPYVPPSVVPEPMPEPEPMPVPKKLPSLGSLNAASSRRVMPQPEKVNPYLAKQMAEPIPEDDGDIDTSSAGYFQHGAGGGKRINRSGKRFS